MDVKRKEFVRGTIEIDMDISKQDVENYIERHTSRFTFFHEEGRISQKQLDYLKTELGILRAMFEHATTARTKKAHYALEAKYKECEISGVYSFIRNATPRR